MNARSFFVRRGSYRDVPGWFVRSRGGTGWPVSIFTEHEICARGMVEALRAGHEGVGFNLDHFNPQWWQVAS